MSIRYGVSGTIIAVGLVLIPLESSQVQPVDPKDIDFVVERISAAPHPYQAVRVRMTVRNTSKKRVGPIPAIDQFIFAKVKGPNEETFQDNRGSVLVHEHGGPDYIEHEDLNTREMTLEPGQGTSVSFAIAAAWKDEGNCFNGPRQS